MKNHHRKIIENTQQTLTFFIWKWWLTRVVFMSQCRPEENKNKYRVWQTSMTEMMTGMMRLIACDSSMKDSRFVCTKRECFGKEKNREDRITWWMRLMNAKEFILNGEILNKSFIHESLIKTYAHPILTNAYFYIEKLTCSKYHDASWHPVHYKQDLAVEQNY